ncbi:sensor histidine kinase [Furfurilactobacillus curtus]|uniref:histidine kinase n=1 Tax=Furfurilactobacillus curtus TaxID=1746200 RepID=A0ABQ5JLY6_9LACO
MKLRNVLIVAFFTPVILSAVIAWLAVQRMLLTGREALELVVVMVGTSIIGLSVSYVMLRPTFRGIRQLSRQTHAIAEQDFTTSVKIERPAELRQLANDLNQMADQLQQTFVDLKRINDERTTMVAQLSHDIKTPLTSIQSQTEAILDGVVSDGEVSDYLRSIEQQVTRLNGLTDDLRALAWMDQPMETLRQTDQIYVDQLLVMIMDGFKPQLHREQRHVKIDLDPSAERLMSNRQAVERVLQNLITNAIHYSPVGTDLTIKVTRSDDVWRCAVIDQGIGIAPADQEKVFKRLYRVEKSRNPRTGGSGLGLYIARQLARQLGGDVTLTSTLDHGSTFVFSLPQSMRVS